LLDCLDELLGIFACSEVVEYELNFAPVEFTVFVVVVKFCKVKSDQLDDDEPDGEEIGFVLVKMGFVLELAQCEELFRSEKVL
jgi:hypothetical protein